MSTKTYADWIDRVFLRYRGSADLEAPARIARIVTGAVLCLPENSRQVLTRRVHVLPKAIAQQIYADARAEKLFGAKPIDVRDVGKHLFYAADYWLAMRAAILYENAPITSVDGAIFEARAVSVLKFPSQVCVVLVSETDAIFDIDWRISIFGDGNALRDTILQQARHLELSHESASALAEALLTLNEKDRILETDRMEEALPANFYRDIYAEFARGAPMAPESFVIPRLATYRHWLGFYGSIANIDDATTELLNRVGLETSLSRWSALPVPLPLLLVESFAKAEDRDIIFRRLLNEPKSPLGTIHLLSLTPFLRDAKLAKRMRSSLLKGIVAQFDTDAFTHVLSIARYFSVEMSRVEAFSKQNAITILVSIWAHSTEVYRALHAWGATKESIEDSFRQRLSRQEDALFLSSTVLRDVAHPSNIVSDVLFASALAYASRNDQDLAADIRDSVRPLLVSSQRLTPTWFIGMGGDDATKSFLGIDRRVVYTRVIGNLNVDDDDYFQVDQLRAALRRLSVEPTAKDAYLISARLPLDLTPELLADVTTAALNPTWDAIAEQDEVAWALLLIAFARYAALSQVSLRVPIRERVEASIAAMPAPGDNAVIAFTASELFLATGDTVDQSVSQYAARLNQLVRKGGTPARIMRLVAQTLKHRLPARLVTQQVAELLLEARLF
ncbi:MAG: hypothetical protein ACYDA1_03665 [Vulcanimicrobiaceae bacterium]